MPKYVIERTVPGVGAMTAADLCALSRKSNEVLDEMAAPVQWLHSYAAEDRLYCVYRAQNAELIREHARRGGFPCDSIRRVSAVIDATTGEG